MNNLIKPIVLTVILSVVVGMFIYLMCAFITIEIDFKQWTKSARIACVGCFAMYLCFVPSLIHTFKD